MPDQSIRQELKSTIPEDLNSMADHLMVTLSQALSIMTTTCHTKPTTPGIFLPRQTAKTYRKLNYHIKHIKSLRTTSNYMDQEKYESLRNNPPTAANYAPQTQNHIQQHLPEHHPPWVPPIPNRGHQAQHRRTSQAPSDPQGRKDILLRQEVLMSSCLTNIFLLTRAAIMNLRVSLEVTGA